MQPKGRWGFPGRKQERIAEGVAKKEINLKLGKEMPKPSNTEQQLAEDIPKKEIAVATGKEAPVARGWFGRQKAPRPPQAPKQEVTSKHHGLFQAILLGFCEWLHSRCCTVRHSGAPSLIFSYLKAGTAVAVMYSL
jgi:hypothetical protein